MNKGKPSKRSKQPRTRKPAAKAQRASQAVIKGPKPSRLRSVGSAEFPSNSHRKPDAVSEKGESTLSPQVTITSPDQRQAAMMGDDVTKTFNALSATANLAAYQIKLPEMGQAYLQLAFDLAQKLAQMKSPLEIPSVLSELMTKQFAIAQQFVFPMSRQRQGIARH